MNLHPATWAAWLAAVAVLAAVVTNPLYLILCVGGILLVHLAYPPDDSPAGRAVRVFITVGIILLGVRLVFVSLLGAPGQTPLLDLPRLQLPRWLGGLGLGGPVTAEVLAEAASEGLRLIVVLAAFGVLNARVDVGRLLRMVPPAFREAGLVASIALAFVPGLVRTARDVRDAQLLRGESSLRLLAPSLVVPVLGITLDRAFLLAESMDARGYGRATATAARPPAWPLAAGLAAACAGLAGWVAGWRGPGTATVAAGLASVAAWVLWSARGNRVPSVDPTRWRARDSIVAGACVTCVGILAFGGLQVGYTAYPRFALPAFELPVALATLLVCAPAIGSRA